MFAQGQTTREAPSYVKPTPREQPSGRRAEAVQRQNRRTEYLRRHPSYFDSLDHELKAPILYERLVKNFQTAQEREAEGQKKGYGLTLEVSLLRGEERLASIDPAARAFGEPSPAGDGPRSSSFGLDEPWDTQPIGKAEGVELWRQFLRDWFVKGRDDDFDYKQVDMDEALDTMKREEAEERWYDEEEPGWVGGEGFPRGETGVQDF